MKKLLLVVIAIVGLTFAANAQNKAIGLRAGGGQGYGTEISYQQGLGGISRLEADLGFYGYSTFGLALIYQIHNDIPAVPNLGWYAGVGGRVTMSTYYGTYFSIGAVAQAGVDYNLKPLINFPLQVSLDIRPCLYLYPSTAFYWGDIALGVRYMF